MNIFQYVDEKIGKKSAMLSRLSDKVFNKNKVVAFIREDLPEYIDEGFFKITGVKVEGSKYLITLRLQSKMYNTESGNKICTRFIDAVGRQDICLSVDKENRTIVVSLTDWSKNQPKMLVS